MECAQVGDGGVGGRVVPSKTLYTGGRHRPYRSTGFCEVGRPTSLSASTGLQVLSPGEVDVLDPPQRPTLTPVFRGTPGVHLLPGC